MAGQTVPLAVLPLSVAIDGPAAAGKSTTAREVARRLGLLYVDSGAMYRALALKLIREGIDADDMRGMAGVLARTRIDLAEEAGATHVMLDGEDVTRLIRDEQVGSVASSIAQEKVVRADLVGRQRALARDRGVVMEGRDIGTVVLPDATLKVFLVATLEVRAVRRHRELAARGMETDLGRVRDLIAERDQRDVEREESPLRAAPDAVTVDTTSLTIEEQVERVVEEAVRRRPGEQLAGPDPSRRCDPASDAPAGGDPVAISGFYRIARAIAQFLFRILFGVRIQGIEHLPATGGFILASNHASFIDPPLLGAFASRRLAYLAKKELFALPGFAHLIRALGAIPIHRQALDREGMLVAKSVLKGGRGLVLFPEGTRSRTGELGPGRPGVSMLAAEAGVPIVPVYVWGTGSLGGALLRRTPILVCIGLPLAPLAPGRGPAWRHELRAHAQRVMDAIAELAPASSPRTGRPMAAKISGQGGSSFNDV